MFKMRMHDASAFHGLMICPSTIKAIIVLQLKVRIQGLASGWSYRDLRAFWLRLKRAQIFVFTSEQVEDDV